MARRGSSIPLGAQARARDRLNAIAGRTRDRPNRKDVSRRSALPDVYEELLAETSDDVAAGPQNTRPAKRRRISSPSDVTARGSAQVSERSRDSAQKTASPGRASQGNRQTVVISSDETQDDDADFDDWEQVAIDPRQSSSATAPTTLARSESQGIVDVSVTLDAHSSPSAASRNLRRRAVTNAERSVRLAVHKTHLLLLLFHAHVRNAWCNDKQVQSNLLPLLSAKIITLMNPDPAWPQLRQSNTFVEGLKMALELWKSRFRYVAQGMEKAQWLDDPRDMQERIEKIQEDMEDVSKADFIRASHQRKGSQDTCAQLFCALLRAAGIDARLATSLQPLPFTATGAKLPSLPTKPQIHVGNDNEPSSHDESANNDEFDVVMMERSSSGPLKPVRPIRRIGQPDFGKPMGTYQEKPAKPRVKSKPVLKLMYPVFWVEAFNPAYQKWIAVDPAATQTVAKSAKLEPPASYAPNQLSYVVALEEDGIMRDVTRRYAHAYNAKTRRLRVEFVDGNEGWWKQAMKPFMRSLKLDRDRLEDGEMSNKIGREGMPKNVQDFKDHPVYALERHLKRHEVICPRREVGKVSIGKGASIALEPVFRRNDVQIVRTADKWYRLGREIKSGEQAMKHVPARSRRVFTDSINSEDEATNVAMYGYGQTQPYIPPPILDGRIPKNVYGNLDVYVASMVPEGGVHIRQQLASRAAKLIGVDFADAVVGFSFKGRQGTAVINGIVVARQYADAIHAVIHGFESEAQSAEDELRSVESLRLWKRFLTGLRIAKRIGLHDFHENIAEEKACKDLRKQLDKAEDEQEQTYADGGFLRDGDGSPVNLQDTTILRRSPSLPPPPPVRTVKISSAYAGTSGMGATAENGSVTNTPHTFEESANTRRSLLRADEGEDDVYVPDPTIDERMTARAIVGAFSNIDEDIDSYPVRESIDESVSKTSPVLPAAETMDTGGGFIAEASEDDTETASIACSVSPALKAMATNRDFTPGPSANKTEATDTAIPASPTTEATDAKGVLSTATHRHDIGESASDTGIRDTSPDAYSDSLPSQDPEDNEDVEPDWLEDAIGI